MSFLDIKVFLGRNTMIEKLQASLTTMAREKFSQKYNNLESLKLSGDSFEQSETGYHNEFWKYGEYELVGHGEQTNAKCGTFKKFMGCLNVELHNNSRWVIESLSKDSVFVKPVYHSCDKPTCPICFKFGWAVREAYRMERRLQEASNRFGLPLSI